MIQLSIVAPVGKGGRNLPADVEKVQQLLNQLSPPAKIAVTKQCDAATSAAIHRLQASFMKLPDDRIDPGGRTWSRLNLIAGGLSPKNELSRRLIHPIHHRVMLGGLRANDVALETR